MLATCEQILDYVKVVCVEDDFDEYEETLPSETSIIWPRHEDGQVAAETLGVGLLKSMLAAKQLRPDRLEIRDKRTSRAPSDPETAALLARNILDGADLTIKAFSVRKETSMTTIIVAELSPEHQGRGTGFSILRKADLSLNENLNSYWAIQILFHTPALKELSLSFSQSYSIPHSTPLILGNPPLPKLEKLDLSMAMLSTQDIMAILGKSEQRLTGISIRLTMLVNGSTWLELLSRIGNEFPHLAYFKLTHLTQEPIGRSQVTFPGLEQDSVVRESHNNGLKLLQKGPVGNKRISGVEYAGSDAIHVLRIVAGYAATASAH